LRSSKGEGDGSSPPPGKNRTPFSGRQRQLSFLPDLLPVPEQAFELCVGREGGSGVTIPRRKD